MDLKQNTISQIKFLTSKLSPGVQHTPLLGAPSKEPPVTEMELLIKKEIDKAMNLKQLYNVTTMFFEMKNIRTISLTILMLRKY